MVHRRGEVRYINTAVLLVHRPERSRVEIADSADADEFLEDAYGVNLRLSRKDLVQREGTALTHERTSVGPLMIDEMSIAGTLDARPDAINRVVAIWPTHGRVSASCDGLASIAEAGDIALVTQPDLPYRWCSEDLRATAVLMEPSVLASVAAGLPTRQASLPIRFSGFTPVDAAAGRLWKDTVVYVRSLLANDDFATPLVIGQATRMLAAVTLSTFPNSAVIGRSASDTTDHKPVLLRRAMEYMDANAGNDIGLVDIADAVHVTPRAVQYMFRRHLETTPLQYLRRLRLHYAHQDLVAASPAHDTVTHIAARWGFAHTGRFAVLYRQTYGQSPHATLRS